MFRPDRILFSKRQAVSTSHFRLPAKRQFCVSKVIFNFWTSFWARRRYFSANFMIFKFSTAIVQNCGRVQIVIGPMDRAERLHAPRYDTRLSWKNILVKFNLVKLIEKIFSLSKSTHSSHPDCHQTCPGPDRILFSKRQAVSMSHFRLPAKRQFCTSKAILKVWTLFLARRRLFTAYFMIFKFLSPWSKTVDGFNFFTQFMDRAELLHAPRYGTRLNWKNIPVEFNLVKLIEKHILPPEKYNTPRARYNIILKEASCLYESLPASCEAPILHQQSVFECLDVFWARRRQFWANVVIFKISSPMV